MSILHEKQISKSRRIAGYLISGLLSLVILAFGIAKFIPNLVINENLARLGVAEYALLIGVIEMVCVVLYWTPQTSNIGFFIFCSYVGAIIVAELILGEWPIPGLVIGIMLYVGTFLRKPSLFILAD